MSNERGMSRRGILKGDWIKIIRNRGVKQLEKESTPEFSIKTPAGQAKRGSSFVHRPPHAVAESEFVSGCTKCDACIQACPPHAIFRAPDSDGMLSGLPMIDADSQPCVMCEDLPCVPVCEPKVLSFDAPLAMGVAKIDSIACLAFRGTICTVCVERCPVEDAITMEAGRPKIDPEICTACGVCLYVCPAPGNAIHLLPN
jgi:ferredoxin-type protein NapF